jgi:uncharacterized membrane protein YkoI
MAGSIIVALALLASPAAAHGTLRTSASQAVEVAEKALSARTIEVELETRRGRLVYEIELVRGDALYAATVDAGNGKLVAGDRRRIEGLWASWFDKDRLLPPGKALGATLAAIERETGGRIEEVGRDTEDGRIVYEVEVTTAAGTAVIAIDPATGKRLPPGCAD